MVNSSGFYIACTRHLNTAAGLEQRIHTFPVLSIVAVGGFHRQQKKPAIERNVNKIPQLTVSVEKIDEKGFHASHVKRLKYHPNDLERPTQSQRASFLLQEMIAPAKVNDSMVSGILLTNWSPLWLARKGARCHLNRCFH